MLTQVLPAGFAHSMALMEGREYIMGWGHNHRGQLGDGCDADRSTPGPCCVGNVTVYTLAAGGDNTFILCSPR